MHPKGKRDLKFKSALDYIVQIMSNKFVVYPDVSAAIQLAIISETEIIR